MTNTNERIANLLETNNKILSDLFALQTQTSNPALRSVSKGTTKTPIQEFTYTIAAGAQERVFFVFNYFRVLSLSASTLSIQLGENGQVTPFTGAGLGVNFFEIFDRVTLYNTGGASITITISLALGAINDDRLNVSGTVSTSPVSPAAMNTTANATVNATTTTQVLAANTSRKEAFISNLSANATVVKVGDSSTGASRGVEIPIGGTAVLATTAAISVYNPSAGSISIGLAETQ